MNHFVNNFKTQLERFWDVGEDEKNKTLNDILQYANSNPQTFKNEVNPVKFDRNLMALPVILEALAADTENWGQFYVDLLYDILNTAKKSNKPKDILKYLQEFSYIENDRRPFVQQIVDILYRELDSGTLEVKLASIWTLPNYLNNSFIQNKSLITDKLIQLLNDENWKVRVVTFKSLGYEKLLPNGYTLSLKDKLTSLIFGWPTMF